MEIEDVSWVGLSAGGSSEQEGHLSVGNSLLGQIVVDDQGVLAAVSEVLTDGASGVGSQELEGGGLRSGGSNDDGVSQGATVSQDLDDVGDGRSLLADGDVDAVESVGDVSTLVEVGLLVDDGVDGDGGLASLSVSNDELSLASADGDLIN